MCTDTAYQMVRQGDMSVYLFQNSNNNFKFNFYIIICYFKFKSELLFTWINQPYKSETKVK